MYTELCKSSSPIGQYTRDDFSYENFQLNFSFLTMYVFMSAKENILSYVSEIVLGPFKWRRKSLLQESFSCLKFPLFGFFVIRFLAVSSFVILYDNANKIFLFIIQKLPNAK